MTENGRSARSTLLPGLEEPDARHPALDQTQPGQAAEVARLIETQYLPQIEGVDGFVSYTLIDLGDDEISSVGVLPLRRVPSRPTRPLGRGPLRLCPHTWPHRWMPGPVRF
jgi:hypothetical protein